MLKEYTDTETHIKVRGGKKVKGPSKRPQPKASLARAPRLAGHPMAFMDMPGAAALDQPRRMDCSAAMLTHYNIKHSRGGGGQRCGAVMIVVMVSVQGDNQSQTSMKR